MQGRFPPTTKVMGFHRLNIFMNNQQRLLEEFKDPAKLVEYTKRISELGDSIVDWDKWFKSDDPFLIWKGIKGVYSDHCSEKAVCYITEEVKRFNIDYVRIIIPSDKDFFDPDFSVQRLTVPAIYVERIENA